MTSSHFGLTSVSRKLAFTGMLLALLAGMLSLAQDDTPITISDGSLTINSAVAWANYTSPDANTKVHPQPGKAVTKVAITMPGHNQVINFSTEKCTVAVRYASTDITFTTGGNGRGLRLNTNFSAFNTSGNIMTHQNANSKISHVVVTKGTQNVFDFTASGGTNIVISYR